MKKLIVEIADKYADAASMTFIGTNCAESEEIRMTVAAVALKPDITAIAVCEDGSSIWYEGDLETKKNQLSIEKLIRQHRIIIAYKQKAPSPKAECVEKHSIFHRKGTLNQTVRDFVAARYRFANANIIFNFAVCFRRPRYRVFRYRKIFFMTAKTCSTLQRTDDF